MLKVTAMCVQYNAYGSLAVDNQTDGFYWPLHLCVICTSCVAFCTEKYLTLYFHEIWHMLYGAACICIYITLNCVQCTVRT